MKWFWMAALLLMAVSATGQPATKGGGLPAPQAGDRDILARMKAIPQDRAVETPGAYAPAEVVKGGKVSLVRRGAFRVAPEAIAAAQAYADEQGSFALIIARGGRIVHEHYAPGFGAESKFATASMHKAVVALAYGPAIAGGRIALVDRLDRFLPELKDDPKGAVTIEQLLRMTSGLGVPIGDAGAAAQVVAGRALSAQLMFGADSRAVVRSFGLVSAPGTEFAYANVSTQLAGLALEAATGVRYSQWLSRVLWAPIGAGDADLWMDRVGGNPHYFCCLQATARDWLRVGELIRHEGKAGGRQVIAADWVRAIVAPSPLNANFGMNLWRGSPHVPVRRYGKAVALTVAAKEPFARDDVVFIDGAGAQRVYVAPSAGLTIVRIGKPALGWDDSALVNLVLAGVAD